MGELHESVKLNDYETVAALLSDGEDPNEVDESGKTPIDFAIDQDIVDLLFMYGAVRDLNDYSDKRYAGDYEMTYNFDEYLKAELILKLKEQYITDIDNVSKQSIKDSDDGVLYDLKLIGVKAINGGVPEYIDEYPDSYALHDLFKRSGYVVRYEGSNNPLEGQTGVYFVE